MNGWIILHKKIWDNTLFVGNPYALSVWIWLLTHCNKEGVVTCGRNQIAKETGVKAETVRYWLTRFLQENHQLTTIKTTNKFSMFSISKWKEYQQPTTNKTTEILPATYQPPTTNKQINNKQKQVLTFKEQNKLAEDRQQQIGYWRGELESARTLQRSCQYSEHKPEEYDERVATAKNKLKELEN